MFRRISLLFGRLWENVCKSELSTLQVADPEALAELRRFFAPYNAILARLLGDSWLSLDERLCQALGAW